MKGASIGARVNLGDHAFVESGAVVGNNVTVKNAVCIWDGIVIEDDVFVGPRVTFTNDRYPRSPRMESVRDRYARVENWLCRTIVRKGASIGASATIGPGVELGEFCMVGAGALVTRDVPAYALVVGTPAVRVADVCNCGVPLPGSHDLSDCASCGQTAQMRVLRVI